MPYTGAGRFSEAAVIGACGSSDEHCISLVVTLGSFEPTTNNTADLSIVRKMPPVDEACEAMTEAEVESEDGLLRSHQDVLSVMEHGTKTSTASRFTTRDLSKHTISF